MPGLAWPCSTPPLAFFLTHLRGEGHAALGQAVVKDAEPRVGAAVGGRDVVLGQGVAPALLGKFPGDALLRRPGVWLLLLLLVVVVGGGVSGWLIGWLWCLVVGWFVGRLKKRGWAIRC